MTPTSSILQMLRAQQFDDVVPAVSMTAAQNLAGLLGSLDKIEEAISLRERLLDHVTHRFPSDDQRVMLARDSLAMLYRRAGVSA